MSAPNRASLCRDEARRDALALALSDGVGAVTWHELVERFGSASQALDAATRADRASESRKRADRECGEAERAGTRILLPFDTEYPERLRELRHPPPVLWATGALEALHDPVVAIVGTRDSSAGGERVARELAGALARGGACVVSGMARGIDAAAHRGALEASGRTVAVLGTGVDIAYPAAHRALHARIAREGLLLSELPLGERAHGGSFPRRNRIIAALASVTIVVEAGQRSGALNTASHALDLGRTVGAVPGPIDQPRYAGSNVLLRDGAHVITGVEDALALAGVTAPVRIPRTFANEAEARVWEALASGPLDADSLCARAALPVRDCIAAIGALELRGAIECALTGEIRRR